MNRLRTIAWPRVALLALVLLCLGYAPIAATELWPYAHPGAPAIGQWLLAHTVSQRYVSDAFADRIGPYRHSLAAMVVHSVLGGLLMVLGPVQLLSAVRRRIRLHRAMGVLFTATVYASMAGAADYLLRTRPADAFSGPTFWIVLATILVGTVLSATMGVIAALTRRPDLHQRWMLLCYGYLTTAPLLRLEWTVLPFVFPGLSVAEINRIAVMHLGSVVVFGALVASRLLDRRSNLPGVTGSWAPVPVLVAAQLVGAAGLGWISSQYLGWGAGGRRLLLAYLVPYLATWAVMARQARRAGRTGRPWAREEWRLHLVGLALAPAVSVALAVPFERYLGLDRPTALTAGVSIGCGLLGFWATAVVTMRVLYGREVVRRAVPDRPSRTLNSPVRMENR